MHAGLPPGEPGSVVHSNAACPVLLRRSPLPRMQHADPHQHADGALLLLPCCKSPSLQYKLSYIVGNENGNDSDNSKYQRPLGRGSVRLAPLVAAGFIGALIAQVFDV